jgi:hypothetical protein
MGVVYYQYKSEKEICSMPVPHAFISVSELKQLIMTSGRHGRGRTRGRATEDIVISNAQTGEGWFNVKYLNCSRLLYFCIYCRVYDCVKFHRSCLYSAPQQISQPNKILCS